MVPTYCFLDMGAVTIAPSGPSGAHPAMRLARVRLLRHRSGD